MPDGAYLPTLSALYNYGKNRLDLLLNVSFQCSVPHVENKMQKSNIKLCIKFLCFTNQ